MTIRKSWVFLCLLGIILILSNVAGALAADPPELVTLRDSYRAARLTTSTGGQMLALIESYIDELTKLQSDMVGSRRNRQDINAIRHELRRASASLDNPEDFLALPPPTRSQQPPSEPPLAIHPESGPAEVLNKMTNPVEPEPAAPPRNAPEETVAAPVPAPAPAPIPAMDQPRRVSPPPVKRQPQTHSSEVRGRAGAAGFSRNNIYSFNLSSIGSRSTLTFWATGRSSTDSFGRVWLTDPAGRRTLVSRWKERFFSIPAKEVSSHEELKPISRDISKLVTVPGIYRIEFEWTDGDEPLIIFRVEINS